MLIILAFSLSVFALPSLVRIAPSQEVVGTSFNSLNDLAQSPLTQSTNSSSTNNPQGPAFNDPHVSSTIINQNTQFSLKWSDPAGMAGYIFSYEFGSSQVVNDSYVSLGNATTATTTTTKSIPGTIGE